MPTEPSNNGRYAIVLGAVNLSSDSIKAILMDTGFTFDEDAHEGYADVSASELSTGNGYTANTKTLTTLVVTQNDTTDRAEMTCDDITWTASTGNIGPSPGMILFDDDVTASGDIVADVILGYIDFGSEITQSAGGTLTIQNIQIDI